jgi:UDP-2,3-diacylglucosamine pyrophosphatase LpxH
MIFMNPPIADFNPELRGLLEGHEGPAEPDPEPCRHRTLFISDVHLGTRGCRAELLVDFLRYHSADTIYLVGDIVDAWRLRRSWHWPQSHNDLVQKLLRLARKGCRIVYLPGNHDEMLRDYPGLVLGGVTIQDRVLHVTADGRRLLVLHGDAFDGVILTSKWLAHLGAWAYEVTSRVNNGFNRIRRWLGYPYWSLAGYLKHQVKNAVSFIDQYERTLLEEARRQGCDGVVCGHIHHAEIRVQDGLLYCNTGDWVDNCTAVAEQADGSLEILRWTQVRGPAARPAAAA